MNYEGEVIGEFVTFRYTSSTHQLWSLWRDGGAVRKRYNKRRTTCTGGRKRCHYTAGSDAQFKTNWYSTGRKPKEKQSLPPKRMPSRLSMYMCSLPKRKTAITLSWNGSPTDDNKTTVKTPGVPLETTFATWHTHLLTSTVQADTLATPGHDRRTHNSARPDRFRQRTTRLGLIPYTTLRRYARSETRRTHYNSRATILRRKC